MRIVAGLYGGRKLIVPKNRDIRPTSDKVRGAIFNALHSLGAVEGAQVLDGFCGTGALGLEALSRGAARCTFIDVARSSLDLARENAAALGAAGTFIGGDLIKAKAPAAGAPFSLVFLDPPYKAGLTAGALQVLAQPGWLAPGALCVVESAKSEILEHADEFLLQAEKIYGDTKVVFYRYDPGQNPP